MKARETMYQCIKQFGSIKTGSFWDVDRYMVNSDGERRKVIITNEDNWLLLSMTDFENHFTQANKPLTEQEWLQTADTEQLAGWIFNILLICSRCGDESQSDEEKIKKCPFGKIGCTKKDWQEWLKQPHVIKE